MARPIIAWSFSALTMFENCPRKFWAVRIAKKVSDVNQWNKSGDDEHKCFDAYLKKRTPLPTFLQKFTPLLDKVLAAPGQRYSEYSMALTNEFIPCAGNDWDNAWVRSIADVLIVNGEVMTYIDWKTGKPKDDPDQIELAAVVGFRHFPAAKVMRAAYVFTNHEEIIEYTVRREQEAEIWGNYLQRVKKLEDAKRTDVWPATPNPLCGYCPYGDCPHNRNAKATKSA